MRRRLAQTLDCFASLAMTETFVSISNARFSRAKGDEVQTSSPCHMVQTLANVTPAF